MKEQQRNCPLVDFPFELIVKIVESLASARDVANLLLTCCQFFEHLPQLFATAAHAQYNGHAYLALDDVLQRQANKPPSGNGATSAATTVELLVAEVVSNERYAQYALEKWHPLLADHVYDNPAFHATVQRAAVDCAVDVANGFHSGILWPLRTACINGNAAITTALLAHKPNVAVLVQDRDALDELASTLCEACKGGHAASVAALLAQDQIVAALLAHEPHLPEWEQYSMGGGTTGIGAAFRAACALEHNSDTLVALLAHEQIVAGLVAQRDMEDLRVAMWRACQQGELMEALLANEQIVAVLVAQHHAEVTAVALNDGIDMVLFGTVMQACSYSYLTSLQALLANDEIVAALTAATAAEGRGDIVRLLLHCHGRAEALKALLSREQVVSALVNRPAQLVRLLEMTTSCDACARELLSHDRINVALAQYLVQHEGSCNISMMLGSACKYANAQWVRGLLAIEPILSALVLQHGNCRYLGMALDNAFTCSTPLGSGCVEVLLEHGPIREALVHVTSTFADGLMFAARRRDMDYAVGVLLADGPIREALEQHEPVTMRDLRDQAARKPDPPAWKHLLLGVDEAVTL